MWFHRRQYFQASAYNPPGAEALCHEAHGIEQKTTKCIKQNMVLDKHGNLGVT